MNISLLHLIVDHLFGHKYFVNVYNRRGTSQICVSSNIYYTRAAAIAEASQTNTSFLYIETVAFRSRYPYNNPQQANANKQ